MHLLHILRTSPLSPAGRLVCLGSLLCVPVLLAFQNSPSETPSDGGAPTTFYVSTNGSDAWSGHLPAPNPGRTDGPFATLPHARDAVRSFKHAGLKSSVKVIVRGGKYYLNDTFILDSRDSGDREHRIIYQAYAGETPILSGGRKIAVWKVWKGKILVAPLPEAKSGKWKFRQLFLNGDRQERARIPNVDPKNPEYGGWAFMEGPAEKGSRIAFRYPAAFSHHWSKPTEGEVVFYQRNGQWQATSPIESMDEKNRTIRLVHEGWQYNFALWYDLSPFLPGNPFYVTNLIEDLDQPGEWCEDYEDGLLYFWPPSGTLQASDQVVAPALHTLVDIQGASWLEVSGFTFTETMGGDNVHHLGVEGAGAMSWQEGWQYCGDTLHMQDAEHCVIQRNRFHAVGGNAIYLQGHNARNAILHNEISYAGANGICLLGDKVKNPTFNTVSDNYIHHIGRFNKYVAGIFSGMNNGNLYSHNRIEYVPHHAINLSNNPTGRNIVEYNLIRFACMEIDDTGAINVWMEQPGTKETERDGHIIRYNYIADTYSFEAGKGKLQDTGWSSGIYLDNYTSNSFVYGNIVVRARTGMQIHAGKNNVIENNIFVNCLRNIAFVDVVSEQLYWVGMKGYYVGNWIQRNIFYQAAPPETLGLAIGEAGKLIAGSEIGVLGGVAQAPSVFQISRGWTDQTVAQSDNNVFFQGSWGKYALQDIRKIDPDERITSFAQWQSLAYDEHSLFVDPLFVDPAHDDYRLKAGSPAKQFGFLETDIAAIGPR
jgi:parallel beta-helix repeat protein